LVRKNERGEKEGRERGRGEMEREGER